MESRIPALKLPKRHRRLIFIRLAVLLKSIFLVRVTIGFSSDLHARRLISSSFPFRFGSTGERTSGTILNTSKSLRENRCQQIYTFRRSFLAMSTTKSTRTPTTTAAGTVAISTVFTKKELRKEVSIPKKFVAKPFDYHQQIIIKIDALTNMGLGIGRVKLSNKITSNSDRDNTDGDENDNEKNERLWVVMVPDVLVGETVIVSIVRNTKSYSAAELMEVLEASPERVKPKCSLAGICGGCQYQHMSIKAQREWKMKHVEEVLLQQDIQGYNTPELLNVLPTTGTKEVYGYRSKITPHYDVPIEHPDGTYEMQAIGFQRSSVRKLVDVPECFIAMPAINEKYKETRARLFQEAKQGLLNKRPKKTKRKRRGRESKGGAKETTLLFRQADDELDRDSYSSEGSNKAVVVTDRNQYMTTTINGLRFKYIAGNFFQNNNYVVPLMVDAVVKAATMPVAATGKSPSKLIDCYCGSGLFAISAASNFDLCVGIELNEKAICEATANAFANGINNCQFMAASAEAIFLSPPEITITGFEQQRVQTFERQETVVIVDPPRKGCSEEFLQQLYDYSPQRIVYMSCGPATQARDAKGIVEVGGYEVTWIEPFDLFPQTKHIESLMVFEKKEVIPH